MKEHTYLCIDLKSFYASVECVERKLDPLTTCLVVADESRTEKTICLAVSPALKTYGIPGRARLFEVIQKVRAVNFERQNKAPFHRLTKESYNTTVLTNATDTALTYLVAPPRMALYLEYSTRIYNIYLRYVAKEDIHVYSVDEVFIDVSSYLNTYKLSALTLAQKMIHDVFLSTGITATAGIGDNLYLSKIAMDIMAKKARPDANGVRIATLDEMTYRHQLWDHRPLTDFWRIGKGYQKKLMENGLFTMGDVARCSIENEELLYHLFGINAELLIDHAWGYEPCTIAQIKAYQPSNSSITSGQVLPSPYSYEKTRLAVLEMAELLSLDLVAKQLVTDQIVLTIGYDIENLTDPLISQQYHGEITTDMYGRQLPKHAHGSVRLKRRTSSSKQITIAVKELFERIINKKLLTRRIHLSAGQVFSADASVTIQTTEQLDLFTDYRAQKEQDKQEEVLLAKEKQVQETILTIKQKYGKNAILKGMNLEEGATTVERNKKIGGHKA